MTDKATLLAGIEASGVVDFSNLHSLLTGLVTEAGVTPQDFGAAADGSTDDLAAFDSATAAAVASGKNLVIPPGTYYLSDTWSITDDDLVVFAWGATILAGGTAEAVQLGQDGARVQRTKFFGGSIIRSSASYANGAGLRLRNANWCEVCPEYVYGFEYGVSIRGTTGQGSSYNRVRAGNVVDCKFPLEIFATGASAFSNENIVEGGRWGYSSSGPDATGGYNVYISAASSGALPNNNKLIGVSLESSKATDSPTAPIYNNGIRQRIIAPRFEGTWTSSFHIVEGADVAASVARNYYDGGRDLDPSKVSVEGVRVRIVGENGVYHKGGDGTNPIHETQEASSDLNVAWRHRNQSGNTVFELHSDGGLVLGSNQDAEIRQVSHASATALDFGSISAGGTATADLSMTSLGTADVWVSAAPKSSLGADFSIAEMYPIAGGIRVRVRNHGGSAATPNAVDWAGVGILFA